ncbi:unnamed protein product [Cylindrotheca closterium]|uniref:Transmembrane protein 110 n=1 Tax=Cylindrotheca closterium TaxID=2856 RepID=A0AAD2FZ22_9STRA|nr:unnamed protein product [Cylindrotheca closterium]
MADDAVADDYVEEELEEVCKVYDSDDFFTIAVQLVLAIAALLSLWFKRHFERPRRKFRTWMLDVSKQGLGACYAHVCNMFIAAVIIENVAAGGTLNDQCAWYGICYLVDTTLGLVLAVWFLKVIDILANRYDWASLKHNGVYEGPGGLIHWFNQVLVWIIIQSIAKVIIYYTMVFFAEPLAFFGGILFEPFQVNIRFELLFVMIFFPGFLNVIYFWIADHFLKADAGHASAHEDDPDGTAIDNDGKNENLLAEEEKQEDPEYNSTPSWTNTRMV